MQDFPISKCRSCQASIIWVKSIKTRGNMPLDAEPVNDGNIVITDDGAVYLDKSSALANDPDTKRYKNHFATCPNAKTHRRVKTK